MITRACKICGEELSPAVYGDKVVGWDCPNDHEEPLREDEDAAYERKRDE